MIEFVSHLEPWEPRGAVLARISLEPFPSWLPMVAWEAPGSRWSWKTPDELIIGTFTVPIITCKVRERKD